MTSTEPTSPMPALDLRTARWIGALYLALAVLAPFSMMYVPSQLLAPGDGVATTARVLARVGLLRAGLVVDLLVCLIEVGLTALLYKLFAPSARTTALAAAFARLSMAALQGASVGVGLIALRLASHGHASLVLVALEARADLVLVWQAFFGLHCVLLGAMVHRSGRFPRVLGALLLAAAAGYLADSFGRVAWAHYGEHLAWLVAPPAVVGELSFALWLVTRRAARSRPVEAAGAPVALQR